MIDHHWYRMSRRMKRTVWRPLSFVGQVLHPLPLAAAIGCGLFLWLSGQLREIYFAMVEAPFSASLLAHWVAAFFVLTLLSATLYISNWRLTTPQIDFIYSEIATPQVDRLMRGARNVIGLLVAAAPWLGAFLGVVAAFEVAGRQGHELKAASDLLGALSTPGQVGLASFEEIAGHLWITAGGIFVVGGLVLWCFHRVRQNRAFHVGVLVALIGVLLAFMLAPVVTDGGGLSGSAGPESNLVVQLFRAIGPMAAMLLVVLGFYSLAALFFLLPGRIGAIVLMVGVTLMVVALALQVPLYWISGAAAVTFVLLAGFGAASQHWSLLAISVALTALCVTATLQSLSSGPGANPVSPNASSALAKTLTEQFVEWRAQREPHIEAYRRAHNRPYPVFIVAAQGGGSYAATSASAFLARLQDLCPAFAQHVFVISGVSGGSVGASFFQSLVADQPLTTDSCPEQGAVATAGAGPLESRVARLVRDDHLSPLLGYVAADVMGLRTDRAVGLEQSLTYSERKHEDTGRLAATFASHWSPEKAAPALVLNSTWADTGYTVAFAPFTLGTIRNGALFTFADDHIRGPATADDVTVARAAVVSARFPGVVPAYTLPSPVDPTIRRNFVDGAYADNSGSETALEIRNIIEERLNPTNPGTNGKALDLRLLLLTSARPRADLKAMRGIFARDTLVPIQTLLNVRGRLAEKAITRTLSALDDLGPDGLAKHVARSGNRDGWQSAVIEVDQESFTLALGWQISAATHSLISLTMGTPAMCRDLPAAARREIRAGDDARSIAEGEAGQDLQQRGLKIADRVRNNSCAMKAIISLVDPGLQWASLATGRP